MSNALASELNKSTAERVMYALCFGGDYCGSDTLLCPPSGNEHFCGRRLSLEMAPRMSSRLCNEN